MLITLNCLHSNNLFNEVKQSKRVTLLYRYEKYFPTLAAFSSKKPLTFNYATYVLLMFFKFGFVKFQYFPWPTYFFLTHYLNTEKLILPKRNLRNCKLFCLESGRCSLQIHQNSPSHTNDKFKNSFKIELTIL